MTEIVVTCWPYACSLPGQAEDYISSKQWEQHGTNQYFACRTYTVQSQIFNNTISRISLHFNAFPMRFAQPLFKAWNLHGAERAHFSIDLALVMASQIPCVNCAIITSHDDSRTFRIFNHLGQLWDSVPPGWWLTQKTVVTWDQSVRLFLDGTFIISESVHSYSFICMCAGGYKFQCYMQTILKSKGPCHVPGYQWPWTCASWSAPPSRARAWWANLRDPPGCNVSPWNGLKQ